MTFDITLMMIAIVVSLVYMMARFKIHRAPTVVGVTFLTLFAMHGISALPYAQGDVGRELSQGVPVSPYFPAVVGLSFAFFAVGATMMAFWLNADLPTLQESYYRQPLEPSRVNLPSFLLFAVVSVVLGMLFVYGAGDTGVEMLTHQSRHDATLREFRLNFKQANPYWYWGMLVNSVFGPILLVVAMVEARAVRSVTWGATAAVLFIVLVLTSTANLHKAPLALLVLTVSLGAMLSRAELDHKRMRRFWVWIVAVVGVVGGVGYYLTYSLEADQAWQATLDRIFVVPQICLDEFLFVYPKIVDFNYGRGIGLVAKMLGDSGYVAPAFMVAQIITGDARTSSNAFWSSELWAAFGFVGVIAGSMFVGALMVWLDNYCLRKRRTPTSIATYAFLTVACLRMPSISLFTALLSGGIALGPIFTAVFLERRFFQSDDRSNPTAAAPMKLRVHARRGS